MPGPGDEKVRIRLPGAGDVVTIAARDLSYYVNERGARLASADERIGAAEASHTESLYGGTAEAVRALGEGGFNALLVGQGDRVLKAMGFRPEKRAQVHPLPRLGGELLGTIVGVAGAGAGGVAGATPLALTGKAAAKLGSAVGGLGFAGSRTAGLIAEGVFDSTVYDMGMTIGKAAVENRELTSEGISGSIIRGGLTGAIGGIVARGGVAWAERQANRRLLKAGSKEAEELTTAVDAQLGLSSSVRRSASTAEEVAGGPVQALKSPPKANPRPGDELTFDPLGRPNPNAGRWEGATAGKSWDEVKAASRGREAARNARKAANATEVAGPDLTELRRAEAALSEGLGGEISGKRIVEQLTNPKIDIKTAAGNIRKYGEYMTELQKVLPADAAEAVAKSMDGLADATRAAVRSKVGLTGLRKFDESVDKLALLVEGAFVVNEATGEPIPIPAPVKALLGMMALNKLVGGNKSGVGKFVSDMIRSGASRAGSSAFGDIARSAGVTGVAAAGARGVGGAVGREVAREALGAAVSKDISALLAHEASIKGRIGRMVTSMLKSSSKTGPAKLSTAALLHEAFFPDEPKPPSGASDVDHFMHAQKQMQRLMSDPKEAQARIERATSGVSALDPELGQLTMERMRQQLDFLWQKMPKNSGALSHMFGDAYVPDPLAVQSWLRTARAVLDPPSVYEDLAAGRLTQEAAEVARTLNKSSYDHFVDHLSKNYDKVKSASLETKVQIAILTGEATHPSLLQYNSLQQTFVVLEQQNQNAQQAAAPNNSGRGTTQGSTFAQGLEARK